MHHLPRLQLPPSLRLVCRSAIVLCLLSGSAFAQAQEPDVSGVTAQIQAMRSEAGLPLFELDPGLTRAALRHSLDMAGHGQLAHVSPRTGDPASRAAEAGVDAARVAENVSRGSSVEAAQASILASDAHRAQLVDPELNRIGIAAAVAADGSVYLTELMARVEAQAQPVAPAPEAPVAPTPPTASAAAAPQVALPPGTQPAPSAPVVAPPPPMTQEPTTSAVVTAPATNPGARQVAGYWVFSRGRWYYYPLPAGAVPGQELTPDLTVTGPPPGYGAALPAQGTTVVAPPTTNYVAPAGQPYVTGGVRVAPRRVIVPSRRARREERRRLRYERYRRRYQRRYGVAPGGRVIIYAR